MVVKLTKEQAEALGNARQIWEDSEMVEIHASSGKCRWSENSQALESLSLDTLIKALYIGYEVEQTPHDKVRELYNEIDKAYTHTFPDATSLRVFAKQAIKTTLDILGEEVEGVNK